MHTTALRFYLVMKILKGQKFGTISQAHCDRQVHKCEKAEQLMDYNNPIKITGRFGSHKNSRFCRLCNFTHIKEKITHAHTSRLMQNMPS